MTNGMSMQSESNGVPDLLRAILLVYLCMNFNPDIRINFMLWYLTTIVTAATLIFYVLRRDIQLNAYVGWLFLFNLWAFISILWALNEEITVDFLKTAAAQMIILIPLSLYIRNEREVRDVLHIIVGAAFITACYILVDLGETGLGSAIIGRETIGEEWNANSIGLITSIAFISCLALVKRRLPIALMAVYGLICIILGYISLYTGSRKTLFVIVAGITLFYLLTSKRKLLVLPAAVGVIGMLYAAILLLPDLYGILGVRIEGLGAFVSGQDGGDDSTLLRMFMIERGINWFMQNPVIGHGINNYAELFGNLTGWVTYSHNNYIELLVGVGLVGAMLYYSMYLYLLKRFVLQYSIAKNTLALFLTLLLIIMAIETGQVSYNNFLVQLVICLGYRVCKLEETLKVLQ